MQRSSFCKTGVLDDSLLSYPAGDEKVSQNLEHVHQLAWEQQLCSTKSFSSPLLVSLFLSRAGLCPELLVWAGDRRKK